jgi:hypothetical protein
MVVSTAEITFQNLCDIICKHRFTSLKLDAMKRLVKGAGSQKWWHTAVIRVLGRLKQEDLTFKARLGYTVRPYLK